MTDSGDLIKVTDGIGRIIRDENELPKLLKMVNESYEFDDAFFLNYNDTDYQRSSMKLITNQFKV